MPKPTIFVSHSHHDNDWCREFVPSLQRLGYDVWYDERGLSSGAQWVRTIERELEGRAVFTIILTPQSWESDWVQLELQLALTTQRTIIPILLKQTDISGFLRTYQRINAENVAVDVVATEFDRAVSPAAPTPPADDSAHDVSFGHEVSSGGEARDTTYTEHVPDWLRLERPEIAMTVGRRPAEFTIARPTEERPRLIVIDGNSRQRLFALEPFNGLAIGSQGLIVFHAGPAARATVQTRVFDALIGRDRARRFYLQAFSHSIKVNLKPVVYELRRGLINGDIITIQDESKVVGRTTVTVRVELNQRF